MYPVQVGIFAVCVVFAFIFWALLPWRRISFRHHRLILLRSFRSSCSSHHFFPKRKRQKRKKTLVFFFNFFFYFPTSGSGAYWPPRRWGAGASGRSRLCLPNMNPFLEFWSGLASRWKGRMAVRVQADYQSPLLFPSKQ